MKEIIKNKLKGFVQKNLASLILTAIILILLFFVGNRQANLVKKAAEMSSLQTQFDGLWREREGLKLEIEYLSEKNGKLRENIDSIKAVQEQDKKLLSETIKRHEREIDSLLNVPSDTVYVRLQPIYPNIGQEPLIYPFSGSQIKQIYHTAISYPRLVDEYSAQTKILQDCEVLNGQHELVEKNYGEQVALLKTNIEKCDEQISLKESQIKIMEKESQNKNFWNWAYKGALVVLGVFAIAK
jgi:hypothetical protein